MLRLLEENPISGYGEEIYAMFDVLMPADIKELYYWRDLMITPAGYEFYIDASPTADNEFRLCLGRIGRFIKPFPDELTVFSAALQTIKNYEEQKDVKSKKSPKVS